MATLRCPDFALNRAAQAYFFYPSQYTGAGEMGAYTLGAVRLYGPASATTPIPSPEDALGLNVGGSVFNLDQRGLIPIALYPEQLTAPGLYRLVIDGVAHTPGNPLDAHMGPQELLFTVGRVPDSCRTLFDLLAAVCVALGCGLRSTVTTAMVDGAHLVDTRWLDAGLAVNEFAGDETAFLQYVPFTTNDGRSARAVRRVVASDPATGTLTLDADSLGTVKSAGTPYLLIRPGRRGFTYARLREALDAAVADLAGRFTVSDAVTLTSAPDRHTYRLPPSWTAVDRVEVQQPHAAEDAWADLAGGPGGYWEWREETQDLYIRPRLGQGSPLRVTGSVQVGLPRTHADIVKVPYTAVRDWVVGYLGLPDPQAQVLLRRAQASALHGWSP